MKPSVGRTVHYVSYGTPGGEFGSACRAATITEVVDTETVGLAVLNPSGMFFNRARYDEGALPTTAEVAEGKTLCEGNVYDGGSWHWPERVE